MFQKMLQGGSGGSEPFTWETFRQDSGVSDYTITNKKGYKMYLFAYNAWLNISAEYGDIPSISGGTILEKSQIPKNNAYFSGFTYIIDITEDTCTISFREPSFMGAILFK